MTKLFMVIPSLKKGGAEKIFSFIANELDRSHFNIYLIIINDEQIQFDLHLDGITLILLRKTGMLKGLPALIRTIKKIKPDVIFTTVTHLNIVMGILRHFVYGAKYKFVIRESSVLSINNKYQSWPKLFNFLIKIFYNRLDVVICQSKDMADDLKRNFLIKQEKIVIINNPITSECKPLNYRKNTTVTFISVGRLVATKGFTRLIEIVARFDFDYRFFIAGNGIEYANLESRIAEMKLTNKVFLLGEMDSLTELYQQGDFYLHGSYYEGFPNTFLEATSHGLPVITFNTLGGIGEIIKDGFNGFIANDEEEYYKYLIKAIDHNWNREQIQKDIYFRFNSEKILGHYEKVLRADDKHSWTNS